MGVFRVYLCLLGKLRRSIDSGYQIKHFKGVFLMQNQSADFKHIVRVVNTDLDGKRQIKDSLRKIKGVGFVLANAVCKFSNIDERKITGNLSDTEVKRIENILQKPLDNKIPIWMLNRRKDMDSGEDLHLFGATLKWQLENDIKMMRKVKSYKGMRHAVGLTVRGQKTKSNFRKKKGKGKSLGVQRKKKGQPKK